MMVADLNDTVESLRYAIASLFFGQRVSDMKLLYRAKYLAKGSKTLAQVGFCKMSGGKDVIEQVG